MSALRIIRSYIRGTTTTTTIVLVWCCWCGAVFAVVYHVSCRQSGRSNHAHTTHAPGLQAHTNKWACVHRQQYMSVCHSSSSSSVTGTNAIDCSVWTRLSTPQICRFVNQTLQISILPRARANRLTCRLVAHSSVVFWCSVFWCCKKCCVRWWRARDEILQYQQYRCPFELLFYTEGEEEGTIKISV